MKILTLSIKQKYFDEILAGKKTHEYREIRPTNAKKYITYLCGGKEYKADEELPEEGEVELKPIQYDAIKLLTGEYKGKRPYIIVGVKAVEAVILTDENGEDITYEYQGEEYLAAQIDYTLGKVLEIHIEWLFNLKLICWVARRVNRVAGPRRNMNGAGAGGRLVARRGGAAGTSQLGSRRQRYADLRIANGLSGG